MCFASDLSVPTITRDLKNESVLVSVMTNSLLTIWLHPAQLFFVTVGEKFSSDINVFLSEISFVMGNLKECLS